jgi:hypothetical protein
MTTELMFRAAYVMRRTVNPTRENTHTVRLCRANTVRLCRANPEGDAVLQLRTDKDCVTATLTIAEQRRLRDQLDLLLTLQHDKEARVS